MRIKFVVWFTFLLSFQGLTQTQFYVATIGDNDNTGLEIQNAWRTIQYAMDNATPNSVVNIMAGTYNEKVEVNVSGTLNNQIVFRNYLDDEVIIDGSGISYPDAIIGIFDQSYVTILNLIIKNNAQLDAQGIIVEGDCKGIRLLNNDISEIHFSPDPNATANSSRNSQPLIVYGSNGNQPVSDLVIEGNTIHDSRTGYSEGLAINGNVDGFKVYNNTVYNISNIGIDIIGHEYTAAQNDQARNGIISANEVYNCKSPYATAAGIYVDGGKDLIIERNKVYDCQWGIEIGCENHGRTTSNVLLRNNWVYDNDDSGLSIGGYDYPNGSGKVVDCEVRHNTFYANDKNAAGLGGVSGELNISYVENCTISNNIFYANNPGNLMLYVYDVNSSNLLLDYNLFYADNTVDYEYEGNYADNFLDYKAQSGQDVHSLNEDPQLSATNVFDLHLTTSSPCRNAGDPIFIANPNEIDIDGHARVQEGRVDIGGDELELVTAINDNEEEILKVSIFPNPMNSVIYIELESDQNNGVHFQLFNSLGQEIMNAILNHDLPECLIDVSQFQKGIYFYNCLQNHCLIRKGKLIKE